MSRQLRKARAPDAGAIHKLINAAAKTSQVLPRSLNNVCEHVRDFVIMEEDGAVIGCCALHVSWEDLAEIRSLVVDEKQRGQGIGRQLVDACLKEAVLLGINRVFLLTAQRGFFEKLDFQEVDKATLPHKIWRDCMECVQFPDCCEVALIKELKS